jgi:hypothetical protein
MTRLLRLKWLVLAIGVFGFVSCSSDENTGPDKVDPFKNLPATAIVGVVTDHLTGEAVDGLEVAITDDQGAVLLSVLTDDNGAYVLDPADTTGRVILRYKKDGFIPVWRDRTIVANEVTRVDASVALRVFQTFIVPGPNAPEVVIVFPEGSGDDWEVRIVIKPGSLYSPEISDDPNDLIVGGTEARASIVPITFQDSLAGLVPSDFPTELDEPLAPLSAAGIVLEDLNGKDIQPVPGKPIGLDLPLPTPAEISALPDAEFQVYFNDALAEQQLYYLVPETGRWRAEGTVTISGDGSYGSSELTHLCGYCYAAPPKPVAQPIPVTVIVTDAFGDAAYSSRDFPITFDGEDGFAGGISLMASVNNDHRPKSTDSAGTADFGRFNVGAGGKGTLNIKAVSPYNKLVRDGVDQVLQPHSQVIRDGEVHLGIPMQYCIEEGNNCEHPDAEARADADLEFFGACCGSNSCIDGVCVSP